MNVNRLSKPHWWQERLRSAPITKCVLAAALLILLAPGVPVHADDPIAEWLKQDESDGQNDQVRLACAHGLATARHFQDWARSSRRPPTHRAWERGAPARSLYLVRNDSCGIWRGNRCSQGRAFCAPSTEHAARAVDTEASVRSRRLVRTRTQQGASGHVRELHPLLKVPAAVSFLGIEIASPSPAAVLNSMT